MSLSTNLIDIYRPLYPTIEKQIFSKSSQNIYQDIPYRISIKLKGLKSFRE